MLSATAITAMVRRDDIMSTSGGDRVRRPWVPCPRADYNSPDRGAVHRRSLPPRRRPRSANRQDRGSHSGDMARPRKPERSGPTARGSDAPSRAVPRPVLVGLSVVGLGLVAWAALRPAALRREPGLSVLLVTVDTLRADALGSYGRVGAETPRMDRLAASGVRFDFAHAHNVVTLPSHANILSGRYPFEHRIRDNAGFRLPAGMETLATILKRHGYRTGAFVSAFPLDSRFGLDRGFDVYDDRLGDTEVKPDFQMLERPGPQTVAAAAAWWNAEAGPSFGWVHIYEPHAPYQPPPAFQGRFARPYDGEVAAADAALAPLLDPILQQGQASRTLVVLTGDHGESLGEHGESTHGIFTYEATLRVPLILHQPRLFGPRVVTSSVRHVDLLPTILDALALPPEPGVAGRSLLGLAQGFASESPASYFESVSPALTRGWAPAF